MESLETNRLSFADLVESVSVSSHTSSSDEARTGISQCYFETGQLETSEEIVMLSPGQFVESIEASSSEEAAPTGAEYADKSTRNLLGDFQAVQLKTPEAPVAIQQASDESPISWSETREAMHDKPALSVSRTEVMPPEDRLLVTGEIALVIDLPKEGEKSASKSLPAASEDSEDKSATLTMTTAEQLPRVPVTRSMIKVTSSFEGTSLSPPQKKSVRLQGSPEVETEASKIMETLKLRSSYEIPSVKRDLTVPPVSKEQGRGIQKKGNEIGSSPGVCASCQVF
jgi:hypothetical protein